MKTVRFSKSRDQNFNNESSNIVLLVLRAIYPMNALKLKPRSTCTPNKVENNKEKRKCSKKQKHVTIASLVALSMNQHLIYCLLNDITQNDNSSSNSNNSTFVMIQRSVQLHKF